MWLVCIVDFVGNGICRCRRRTFVFTPAERSAFERARRAVEAGPVREKVDPDPDTLVPVIEDLPLEAKPMITIDGYVRRSHGTATL